MVKWICVLFAMTNVCTGLWAGPEQDQYLYDALKTKNFNKIQYALQQGANPNQKFANTGISCFNWAVENNVDKKYIETFLVDSKVTICVNGSDDEYPVLFHALKAGRKDLIKLLVKYGAEPNYDYYGKTPLIFVTELKKSVSLNDFIIECKFDPEKEVDLNLKDRNGNTALFYAIKNKDPKSIDILIKQGADITNIDNDDNDAICLAVKEKINADIVDKLLENYDGDFTKLFYRSSGKYKNKNPIEIMRTDKTERMYEDIFNNYQ